MPLAASEQIRAESEELTASKAAPSAKESPPFRIVIVDDHPLVRQGLAMMLAQEPDLEVCAEADDAESALRLLEQTVPDLAIIDISLRGMNGIDLIKAMAKAGRLIPVLVVSTHDESLYAERALRAGARGYVAKHEASETVLEAIRRIRAGEIYVSDSMAGKMLQQIVLGGGDKTKSHLDKLSDRELEVFQLIGQGLATRDIATKLHLSVKTIESNRARIKEKLKAGNATELLRMALQWVQDEGIN